MLGTPAGTLQQVRTPALLTAVATMHTSEHSFMAGFLE